jgi:thiosulfate/3-mercaptopyruvate sulfurtransferase
MWATRLWWQLRFFGFDAISVLDGGLPAWRAHSLPVDAGDSRYNPRQLVARARTEWLVMRDEVEAVVAAGDGATCLVKRLRPRCSGVRDRVPTADPDGYRGAWTLPGPS